MRKRTSRLLIVASIVFILFLAGAFVIYKISVNKPPIEEIKRARESITLANVKNANKYAKNQLKKSVALYDSAMFYWEVENQKFILFRNYGHVKFLANESNKLSMEAGKKAATNSGKLKSELKKELDEVHNRIVKFKSRFDRLPAEQIWRQFNAGKLKYEEAKAAYDDEQLFEAKKKLSDAKVKIDKCYSDASHSLTNYFSAYLQWQKITKSAINYSANNKSYAIIIDKFARQCMLYYKGAVVDTYKIELGKNWMGSKNHSGDFTTPEGSYKIIDRKERHKTKYHKALLLNYPNDEDKKRFHDNKKNGVIAKNKSIGGLIEIHGEGGQGADWTEGCIALSNKDMDRLYSKCSVGTPVIIVGSLAPLDSLFR